jgi:hypothetical protein
MSVPIRLSMNLRFIDNVAGETFMSGHDFPELHDGGESKATLTMT